MTRMRVAKNQMRLPLGKVEERPLFRFMTGATIEAVGEPFVGDDGWHSVPCRFVNPDEGRGFDETIRPHAIAIEPLTSTARRRVREAVRKDRRRLEGTRRANGT